MFYPNLKTFGLTGCILTLSLLAACASNPTGGYYDANGKFISNNPQNRNAAIHAPNSGAMTGAAPDYYGSGTTRVIIAYDRPGYYDYNGYYIPPDGGLNVPESMLPPRGMCRIWLPGRADSAQPPVESCDHIQMRVPMGAYVVYGGK